MSTNAVWNSYVKNTGSPPKNAFKLIVYSRRSNNLKTLTFDEAKHLIDTHTQNKPKLSKNNKISPKSSKQNNKTKKKSNKKKIKNDSVSERSNKSTTKSTSNSKKKSKYITNKNKNQLLIPSKLKHNKSRSHSVTTKSKKHSDQQLKSKTKSHIKSKRKQTNKNNIISSNKINSKKKSKNINNKNPKIYKKTLLIPSKPKLQNSSSHSIKSKSKKKSEIKSINIESGSKLTKPKLIRSRSNSCDNKNNLRVSLKQKHKNNTTIAKTNLKTPKTKNKIRSKSISIHKTNTNIKSKQKTHIKNNKKCKIEVNSMNNKSYNNRVNIYNNNKTIDKSEVNSVAHSISVYDENNNNQNQKRSIGKHKKNNKNNILCNKPTNKSKLPISSNPKLQNSFSHSVTTKSKKHSHKKKQIKLALSKSRNDINSVSATAKVMSLNDNMSNNSINFLTLSEIVEHVTSPQIRGTQNQLVLILTYCLYISRKELLSVIFERLARVCDDQIQIKVFSLLRTWLKTENDFKNSNYNDDDDKNVGGGLPPFALHFTKELMLNIGDNELLQKLAKPIISQISQPPKLDNDRHRQMSLTSAPIPRIPKYKNEKDLNLNNINPTEIARQICLIEYNIFSKIKPEEFLKQKSTKQKKMEQILKSKDIISNNSSHNLSEETLTKELKDLQRNKDDKLQKQSTQPNIDKMTDWFNRLVVWTQVEILYQRQLTKRAKTIALMLKICHALEQYNNISSLCAIRAGLCSSSIHRLRKTWQNIPKKARETKDKIDELFKLGNGQKNLRDRVSIISQPAIPHLGLFLGDIVFIHDGNDTFKTYNNGEKKINWNKMKMLSDRIAWISMFQQSPFVFKTVPIICEYLQSRMKIVPEDFLYKLSREVEPPQKKT
eukprot:99464_1